MLRRDPRNKIKFLKIQVDSDDQGVSKKNPPDRAVKTVLVFYRPGMIIQGKALKCCPAAVNV